MAGTTNLKRKKGDVGSMSQWQLISMRFRRHRLASLSLLLLGGLYLVAIFAGFFSVNDPVERDVRYMYAPPMLPSFSFKDGFHMHPRERHSDPITLRTYFTVNRDTVVPLGFLVKGHSYRLAGLIPCTTHFFGVKAAEEGASHSRNGSQPAKIPAKAGTTSTFSPDVEAFVVPPSGGSAHNENAWEEGAGAPAHRLLLLGGDKFGRDIYSRLLSGARISLSIGLVAIVISFTLGVSIGGISGYFGGGVDNLIQRTIEIINAFPKLPLWLALGAALPRSWSNIQVYLGITVILSLMGWTGMARVVRGKILALREEDYAVAARLLGASHARVLFRHLVPGFTSHIIVSLTMTVPGMILGETSLSFLGLGLKSPTISWGVMLQDCMSMQVVKSYPWLLLPVGAIVLTVMCFNFMGDGLRDAADPYNTR